MVENEFKALKKLFNGVYKRKFHAVVLRINGSLIAFDTYEYLKEGFILGHIIKILKGYKGAEEIMFHKIASECLPQGYKYFNVQDDLGIEGLRQHKLNLHPAFFIKSYIISPKS